MLGVAYLTGADAVVQADSLNEVQERLDQLGIPFRRQEVVEGGITIQQVTVLHCCKLAPPYHQMHAQSGHACRTPAAPLHLMLQMIVDESFMVPDLPQPPHDFACASAGHPQGARLKLAQMRFCLNV